MFFFVFFLSFSLFFVTGRVLVYLSAVTCCSYLKSCKVFLRLLSSRMLAGYILSVFKGALCSFREEILNLNTYDINEVIIHTFFPP